MEKTQGDRAKIIQTNENRINELEGLYEIAQSYYSIDDVDEVYGKLCNQIAKLIGAESCLIVMHYPEKNELRAQGPGYNVDAELVKSWVVGLKEKDIGEVLVKKGGYNISNDAYNDSKLDSAFMKKHKLRSVLNVPLVTPRRTIGLVNVFNKPDGFVAEDAKVLSFWAHQAAITIENSMYYEELKVALRNIGESHEKLKAIDKVKSDILSNVSHELRTPITIAKLALEMLEIEKEENLELVTKIKESLHRQSMIVNYLIEAAGLGRIGIIRKATAALLNIPDLINEVIDEFKNSADEKGVVIKRNIDENLPEFYGHRDQILHVLRNLIGNSVKFNKQGGSVELSVLKKEGKLELKVKDTGLGILKRDLKKIFEPFYQSDPSSTRQYGGTGMGLAIVKGIVASYGGTISVESTIKKGTTFTVSLPFKTES